MPNAVTVMKRLYHVLMHSVPAVKHALRIVQHVDTRIQGSTATAEIKAASTAFREAAQTFYGVLVAYRDTFYVS